MLAHQVQNLAVSGYPFLHGAQPQAALSLGSLPVVFRCS